MWRGARSLLRTSTPGPGHGTPPACATMGFARRKRNTKEQECEDLNVLSGEEMKRRHATMHVEELNWGKSGRKKEKREKEQTKKRTTQRHKERNLGMKKACRGRCRRRTKTVDVRAWVVGLMTTSRFSRRKRTMMSSSGGRRSPARASAANSLTCDSQATGDGGRGVHPCSSWQR